MRRASLLFGALLAAVAMSSVSPARSASEHRAVVVVELLSGQTRSACVVFKEASITGLDLLVAAQMEPATYGMGQGTAVCKLCGEGCPTTRNGCLSCDGGKYWQYYRSDGEGPFQYSNVGAGNSTVTDGDVDGWTFGSSRKDPLLVAVETVCSDPERTFRYEAASQPPQPSTTTTAASPTTVSPAPASPVTTAAPPGSSGTVPARTAATLAPSAAAVATSTTIGAGVLGTVENPTSSTSSTPRAAGAGDQADESAAAAGGSGIPTSTSSPVAYVLFAVLLTGIGVLAMRARRAARR